MNNLRSLKTIVFGCVVIIEIVTNFVTFASEALHFTNEPPNHVWFSNNTVLPKLIFPKFNAVFGELTVDQRKALSLKCVASGTPLPQVTWSLDASPIGEHLRVRVGDYVTSDGFVNSFVNITSVKVEDGGVYGCQASNGIHTIRHTGRINVYGPPFVKPMSNVTVVSGTTLRIDCPYSGHPIQSVIWRKRDAKLPQNHRQIVFPNGTLIILKAERGVDDDQYKCTASNKASESASSDVYVNIIVAPLISPFNAPPNLREGMRSMLTCSVLEGDAPFQISWFKDGRRVERGNSNIKLSSTDEFSSTLTINKVSFEDNGNYTCVVMNTAASTNYTVNMLVKVPPKWVIVPKDTDAILGHDVLINCQATGYPQPRIWWEHAETLSSTAGPSHYQPVISNSHIHALENGSLIIKEITKKDEGFYLCQATNSVSSGISKVVKVTVHVPAFFKSSFSAQTVKKGSFLEISCDAEGEKPLNIVWSKDRAVFDPRKELRYQLIESLKEEGLHHLLKIKSADRRDSALFTCTASNAYGKDEYNVQVILQEIPDKPETVIASQIESRRAVISWTIPYSGNSPILSYHIEYRVAEKSADFTAMSLESASGNVNSFTLRKLRPLTSYEVRVKCENSLGWSEYSDIIHFTSEEEAPSGPPKNVHVYPLTSRALQVTWKPPDAQEHNGIIKGYYLGYRLYGSTGPYVYKTLDAKLADNSDSLGTKIINLNKASKYGVILQAFNGKGAGPQSEEIVSETLANDPPPSPQLTVTSADYTSVEVAWNFEDTYPNSKDNDVVIN
ncbi:Down syndrome cell adhesion molecule-like protein, partial [Leptotrombidium deliense]